MTLANKPSSPIRDNTMVAGESSGRREFLIASAAMAASVTLGGWSGSVAANAGNASSAPGALSLPPLPYPDNALEPIISANTIGFHYGKHHKGYVDNLNKLVVGSELADQPLQQIMMASVGKADRTAIFNNSAQIWNHNFYWWSLRPNGGGEPPAALAQRLEGSFGSVAACKKELAAAALGQFGSGWAWLVQDGDKIKVLKTGNADNPLTAGLRPLLTIDVGEPAYYLAYQNRRADYVNAVIDKLLNWEFALQKMA